MPHRVRVQDGQTDTATQADENRQYDRHFPGKASCTVQRRRRPVRQPSSIGVPCTLTQQSIPDRRLTRVTTTTTTTTTISNVTYGRSGSGISIPTDGATDQSEYLALSTTVHSTTDKQRLRCILSLIKTETDKITNRLYKCIQHGN
jgi:hypothetical protein